MREIKFRGKRLDLGNGDWIYGGYYVDTCYGNKAGEKHYIMQWNSYGAGYYEPIRVVPETVGQFTGIKDKNGVEIYEGDILKATSKYKFNEVNGVVVFEDYQWFGAGDYLGYVVENSIIEVIGNIHDKEETQ